MFCDFIYALAKFNCIMLFCNHMMMLKFRVVLCCLILGVVSLPWAFSAESEHPKTNALRKAFDVFMAQNAMEFGQAALTVIDSETGQPVFSENGRLGMATASTLKNITAASAFHVLGADFRFETVLGYVGELDEAGILHGHLVIRGNGDPTLGSPRYERNSAERVLSLWLEEVRRAGIKQIKGNIIVDDLLFDGYQTPGGWPWRDMGNYYGAGVSSVNWRENSVGVVFHPGAKVGDPTRILRTTNDISSFQLVNEVTTGRNGSGDNVYGYAAPYSDQIYLRGTHGADLKKTIRLSTPDPARVLALELKNYLAAANIPSEGAVGLYGHSSKGLPVPNLTLAFKELHRLTSPTLPEIIYEFNQESINLYGESLLKAVALKLGKDTETSSAAAAVRSFWSERLTIPIGAFKMVDGSGLSPDNRLTTDAMVEVLQSCIGESWFASFVESIPTNNGMKMKSGTIGGVLGYAGYHTAKDGKKYTFAFLISNYQGGASQMRRQMFKLLDELKE